MNVNLDLLVAREDFEIPIDGDAPVKQSIDIKDLEHDAFFYGALRKPDFQRETDEWDPQRVLGLIQTFIDGDLIPAVILWKNRELLFVIDGSHRLSALIAWAQDDYGDGEISRKFFDTGAIPDDQKRVAEKTRILVNSTVGSYQDHKNAIRNPDKYGPDIREAARALGSRPLQLQWVKGDARKAEASFIRINRKAVNISPQELELIEKRKKPQTIAARAIKSRGTGHKYWSLFPADKQKQIEELATEIHDLMFQPALHYPIESLDLPPGGPVYSAPTLRMVYDFVALCVGVVSQENDEHGTRTIEYLERCRRVMWLLLSSHPSSLGLHPAIYFYSWTGNQQPILFLVVVSLILEMERSNRLVEFTDHRKVFEEFLFSNRTLLNQIIRKFGTKDSGVNHLGNFYRDVLSLIGSGCEPNRISLELAKDSSYSYLQPGELAYDGVPPTRMSKPVRAGLVMNKLLEVSPRCHECGGFLPSQAISLDHTVPTAEGGLTTKENTSLMHRFCNHGVKEQKRSHARKSKA